MAIHKTQRDTAAISGGTLQVAVKHPELLDILAKEEPRLLRSKPQTANEIEATLLHCNGRVQRPFGGSMVTAVQGLQIELVSAFVAHMMNANITVLTTLHCKIQLNE